MRRLRSWLKHERQTVCMVLAETFHNSSASFPPKFKEEWVERHEQHTASRGQKTARTREATYCTSETSVPMDASFFQLYDEEDALWGTRPGPVLAPRPQERCQRHILEHAVDVCPFVQILDAPVLQIRNQLPEIFGHLDTAVPEQDRIQQRLVGRDLRLPLMPEPFAEVPTILYFLKQRIPEQLVDIPVRS